MTGRPPTTRNAILAELDRRDWTTWNQLMEAVDVSYFALRSVIFRLTQDRTIVRHPEGHAPDMPARYSLR